MADPVRASVAAARSAPERSVKPGRGGPHVRSRARAPVAAAAAGSDTEPAETATGTLTEKQARRSGEEFDARIAEGMSGPEAAPREADDDDEGPSDVRNFAIGAAGLVGLRALRDHGGKRLSQMGDRVVVQRGDGDRHLLRDDKALIRRACTQVETQTRSDGSARIVSTREGGTQIVTVRAPAGEGLRRTCILPDARQVVRFDDTDPSRTVEIDAPPRPAARTVDLDQTYTDRGLRAASCGERDGPSCRRTRDRAAPRGGAIFAGTRLLIIRAGGLTRRHMTIS